MSAREGLQATKRKGLFYRTHPSRKHGHKKDRQWVIRQTLGGKTRLSVLGWQSEGMTEAKALIKLDSYKANYKWNKLHPNQPAKPICLADEKRLAEIEAKELKKREEQDATRPTFNLLWERYSQNLGSSLAADHCRFHKHLNYFHNKTPDEIVPLDIERLKKNLANKKLSPQSIKHCLTLLTRLVNFGVDQQLCRPLSFRIKKPSFDNRVTEVLDSEQLQSLLLAIDTDLKHDPYTGRAMLLALATGMRRGELIKLKWDDIDFTRGFITLKNTKSGKTHNIPINTTARQTLKSIPKTSSPFVFPGKTIEKKHNDNPIYKPRADFNRGARRIKKAAGLPSNFRPFHGLRHHFASTLASSGQVDLYTLQKLMTHADPQTTERYAHLHDDRLKLGAEVADTILQQKPNKQTGDTQWNISDSTENQ